MLAAVLLVNIKKGNYIVRPLVEIDKEKCNEIIETFLYYKSKTKETKGILSTDIGEYFYQELDETYVTVLGDREEDQVFKGINVLESVIKTFLKLVTLETYPSEVSNIICAIDEIFTQEGVIDRSVEEITKILSFQSNDEMLHQMIEKNREKEAEKVQRMQRKIHPVMDELAKEIEEIKILKKDLKASPVETPMTSTHKQKSAVAAQIKECIGSMESPVNLITHQKLVSTINSTTEQTKTEGIGELLIKVTDDRYTLPKIDLESHPTACRAHPLIDKKSFTKDNSIVPKTDIPLDKTLTLLKWTIDTPQLPIEALFWQNELSEERYKFFIEVTAQTTEIKHIEIKVPIKRISDIEISEGQIEGDMIIREIHSLEAGDTGVLEFSGLCDNTDSLFPFFISYTIEQPNTLTPIQVSRILTTAPESEHPITPSDLSCISITEGICTVVLDDTL
ncbi:coatomer subunit delta [Nematocida sp. AWRm80]|nr:coatomer subunit delta [Nematocida sp. AWRm80]